MRSGHSGRVGYRGTSDRKGLGFTQAFKQFGAGNEIRTRDPNLGKVVLYQLSYSRIV